MGSQLFDSSSDPRLAFASETPVAPAVEREPAFLRIPTAYDAPLSITSIAEPSPGQSVRGRLLSTVAVVIGVLAGFAAGYGFAYRVIASAQASTVVVASPVTPPTPSATPSIDPPRDPSLRASAQPADAKATTVSPTPAVPSTPATRSAPVTAAAPSAPVTASAPSAPVTASAPVTGAAPVTAATASAPATRSAQSTRAARAAAARSSATTRPQAAAAPVTSFVGSIVVQSRPRDALVLLDGNVVGRAPLSIPDVSEGTHEVRVELDGFTPWVGVLRVKGGSRSRVGASLAR